MTYFVHHYTGEWVRNDANTSATRTQATVTLYRSLDEVQDQWIRQQFQWAYENGEPVTQTGSHVFQIRQGELK